MKQYRNTLIAAAAAIFLMASCSTEEAVITSPKKVIERIDMVLEGNETESVYLQSAESEGTVDLIEYNFYGSPSHQIDFKVNLDAQRTLVFKIVDEADWNPWETASSYSIYASQDLEDKQRFVTVEMIQGGEAPIYLSNIEGVFPNGTNLNAFSIENYDISGNEILCRVVDLELASTTGDQNETILINGTFRGSLTFLD